jgi:HlyD family secretion protein
VKRRIVVAVAVAVLAVAGGLAAVFWLERGDSGNLVLYGNVDIREADLSFRVGGRLESLEVDEGDRVAAGDLLAKLNDEPQREALAAANAKAGQARAVLDRLLAGSRPQEIESARAHVREAEAAVTNTEQTLARQRDLVAKGVSNQSLLDDALAAYDQARARLVAARESLALAEEGPRTEDIAAARAALAVADAERARAQTALDDTELRAPDIGTISVRVREVGAVLAEGQPVYTLTLDSRVYVRAYVEEPDLAYVAPGVQVRIETDAGEHAYQGQIGFVSPRAEFTPRTVETPELRTDLVYRLRIIVDDADAGLRQGMPVTVHVPRPEA